MPIETPRDWNENQRKFHGVLLNQCMSAGEAFHLCPYEIFEVAHELERQAVFVQCSVLMDRVKKSERSKKKRKTKGR